MKKFFLNVLFFLSLSLFASCSMSFQSIAEILNYTKNSADVLSFVTTDKTTTDHALSYLFKKDCSLSRSFKFKKICEEINKENLEIDKRSLNLVKTKKIYKKRIVKVKKIKVPSMAY